MEALGYLIFGFVIGMVGWHFYSKRSNGNSTGGSTGGGGGRNPSSGKINRH